MSRRTLLLSKRLRWATVLFGLALVVVLSRTAILPRLVFAQRAANERAVALRERSVGHDKIRHAKNHVTTGKSRHLAPLDVDDDGDDDGDDDCLTIDETIALAPGVATIAHAVFASRVTVASNERDGFREVRHGAHGARAPPSRAS